jgi:ribosome-associated protein
MMAWSAFSGVNDGVLRKGIDGGTLDGSMRPTIRLPVDPPIDCKVPDSSRLAGLAFCQYEDDPAFRPFPTMTDLLQITETIAVPRTELLYRASRSGGAGGQHVNTSSTRIELLWDFERSAALDDSQKARVREKLAARIDAEGLIRVVAGNRRSQLQNRQAAEERLAKLVRDAMHVPRRRRATAPTRASREKRLDGKRRLSHKKKDRRKDSFD